MVRQSQQVMAALAKQTEQRARRLLTKAKEVLPLVEGVIAQTRRRVLSGKKMASERDPCSVSLNRTPAPFPTTKAVRWWSLDATSSSMKWRVAS
jgi:hypothetical protein